MPDQFFILIGVYPRLCRYNHHKTGTAQLDSLHLTFRSGHRSTGCNGIYLRLIIFQFLRLSFVKQVAQQRLRTLLHQVEHALEALRSPVIGIRHFTA